MNNITSHKFKSHRIAKAVCEWCNDMFDKLNFKVLSWTWLPPDTTHSALLPQRWVINVTYSDNETDRVLALRWWRDLTFEEQFYKVIKHLGTTRHPDNTTSREIEEMWNKTRINKP